MRNTQKFLRDIYQNRKVRKGLFLLAMLSLLLPLFGLPAGPLESAALSFDDRLSCQADVEKVYWQHRIWPAENPGAKPDFVAVVKPEDIQKKVENTLRRSNALVAVWQQEITGEMLQAEMNRMAAQTRQPEILADLWAALNHDPVLVAECLARPALANRLLRNFYTGTATDRSPESSS